VGVDYNPTLPGFAARLSPTTPYFHQPSRPARSHRSHGGSLSFRSGRRFAVRSAPFFYCSRWLWLRQLSRFALRLRRYMLP
jgi:hypothetical protein